MNETTTVSVGAQQEQARGMKELLAQKGELFEFPKEGEIIEGKVLEKGRNKIFFDLGAFRTGVVYKAEVDLSMYDVNEIRVGQVLPVKILALENDDGLVELSLREAGLDRTWDELRETKEKGEVFEIILEDANRGGLLVNVKGVQAFLPVSQLAPEHYPRVEGGDKEKIYEELKQFVGTPLEVKILDLDQGANKLILSEKAKVSKLLKEKLAGYEVGQVIEGAVSGIVDFGAFITFNGIEGLAHISELGWQLVEDPHDVVSIGEAVSAKIIDIEGDKVSLSLKALKPNPWDAVAEKYKVGDTIEGEVVKFNPFGAFVRVEPEIQGLAHISEFGGYDEMIRTLEMDGSYTFTITMLEPQEYKMALKLVTDEAKAVEKEPETAVADAAGPTPEESGSTN